MIICDFENEQAIIDGYREKQRLGLIKDLSIHYDDIHKDDFIVKCTVLSYGEVANSTVKYEKIRG